ncbi:FecR family protein [Chitinophaga jiangningensis]|uniref:FecR family protein n=1 Tax=Chitinophaga jiangningensis TaxID=1419482 RepID=A0A1M7IKQ0_9BACT|nr:FecR family protein [Chitinophaga jiangningensis]SHM41301.1 FecR family protein [Chitinophaga jiangningensis]
MNDTDFKILFQKYLDDAITPEEMQQLQRRLESHYPAAVIDELWESILQAPYTGPRSSPDQLAALYRNLKPAGKVVTINWKKAIQYAAAMLLLVSAGTYLYYQTTQRPLHTPPTTAKQQPILPATGMVTLTLADGSRVAVDSLGNQTIRQQGALISKTGNELVYAGGNSSTNSMNTLSTPRGRQFQVKLPDGTRVWLNAASSLSYPTTFTGPQRKVTVAGEAYFEVAANPQQPFVVATAGSVVEVLGTSFNINAYEPESQISTTLLDGAVRVSGIRTGIRPVVLRPGQESRLTNTHSVVEHADLEKTLAWKKGYFNFEGATLHQVLNELQRWYDIEVVYEGNVKDIRFGGELSRSKRLDQIITALKDNEVHFRLEGNKLTVLP